jgi:hypothetical protein
VVAVDVNHGHLAAAIIAPDGNVLGVPATIPLGLAGLPSATRDGRLRAAISALIAAKPGNALEILRDAAASGPDGRRHVAAGALFKLGEEPPRWKTDQQWLFMDLLTALTADDLREHLSPNVLEAIRADADDLWRSGHPAAARTLEATADALRGSDKILAKRLRRCAHKARNR